MRTFNSLKQLTLYQFRNLFRQKIALFFNLIMPLLLLAVFGAAFGNTDSTQEIPIGVVDLDQGPAARALRDRIDRMELFKVTTGEQAALQQQVAKGSLKALVIMPQGMSEQVAAKRGPAAIRVVVDPNTQAGGQALGTLHFLAQSTDAPPTLILQPEPPAATANLSGIDFLMAGQLSYMMLSAGLMSVAMWLAFQRQTGALRHMFSTPVSMGLWLASRVAANLVMTAVQVVVLFTAGVLMFDVHLPANLPGTIVVLVLGCLSTLGLGMIIGSTAKNTDVAMPIGISAFMALTFFGGAMMPLEQLPPFMTVIGKFTPTYYMTHSLKLVMMQGSSLAEVIPHLGVMAATGALLLILAAWRLRKQFVTA